MQMKHKCGHDDHGWFVPDVKISAFCKRYCTLSPFIRDAFTSMRSSGLETMSELVDSCYATVDQETCYLARGKGLIYWLISRPGLLPKTAWRTFVCKELYRYTSRLNYLLIDNVSRWLAGTPGYRRALAAVIIPSLEACEMFMKRRQAHFQRYRKGEVSAEAYELYMRLSYEARLLWRATAAFRNVLRPENHCLFALEYLEEAEFTSLCLDAPDTEWLYANWYLLADAAERGLFKRLQEFFGNIFRGLPYEEMEG